MSSEVLTRLQIRNPKRQRGAGEAPAEVSGSASATPWNPSLTREGLRRSPQGEFETRPHEFHRDVQRGKAPLPGDGGVPNSLYSPPRMGDIGVEDEHGAAANNSRLLPRRSLLDSRLRGNDRWGVQRGETPLRLFLSPKSGGSRGLKTNHPAVIARVTETGLSALRRGGEPCLSS